MATYLLLYLMQFSLHFFFLSSIMQGFCYTIYFILFFPKPAVLPPTSHHTNLISRKKRDMLLKSYVPHAPLKPEAD